MRKVIEDEELLPMNERQDTEVTLGPMAVTGLIFGLLLLCGLCFGLGYSMGGHGPGGAVKAAQPASVAAVNAVVSSSKPGAASQTISTEQPAAADNSLPGAAGVNPALPGQPSPSGSDSPLPATVSALMVQIATVSHQEDVGVLVAALLKRGYAVSVLQDPADSQFHVRVGPFADLNDANAMRQKLLNDGYNAVVQP
jgi:cell division septation protein DedD